MNTNKLESYISLSQKIFLNLPNFQHCFSFGLIIENRELQVQVIPNYNLMTRYHMNISIRQMGKPALAFQIIFYRQVARMIQRIMPSLHYFIQRKDICFYGQARQLNGHIAGHAPARGACGKDMDEPGDAC